MKCTNTNCNNEEMSIQQRETEFSAGWVGVTMYEQICSDCFDKIKEER
jgi:hypothetical protein